MSSLNVHSCWTRDKLIQSNRLYFFLYWIFLYHHYWRYVLESLKFTRFMDIDRRLCTYIDKVSGLFETNFTAWNSYLRSLKQLKFLIIMRTGHTTFVLCNFNINGENHRSFCIGIFSIKKVQNWKLVTCKVMYITFIASDSFVI